MYKEVLITVDDLSGPNRLSARANSCGDEVSLTVNNGDIFVFWIRDLHALAEALVQFKKENPSSGR